MGCQLVCLAMQEGKHYPHILFPKSILLTCTFFKFRAFDKNLQHLNTVGIITNPGIDYPLARLKEWGSKIKYKKKRGTINKSQATALFRMGTWGMIYLVIILRGSI
jgi:hypothetical protein